MTLRLVSYLFQAVGAVFAIWRFLRGWSHLGQVAQFSIGLLLAFGTGVFGSSSGFDFDDPSLYVVTGCVTTLNWMAFGRPEAWQRPSRLARRLPNAWERRLLRMTGPLSVAIVVMSFPVVLFWSLFSGAGPIVRVTAVLLFALALSLYLLAVQAWRRLPPADLN
jgi:hypothetical protein